MSRKLILLLSAVLISVFMLSCGENTSSKHSGNENIDQNDNDSEELNEDSENHGENNEENQDAVDDENGEEIEDSDSGTQDEESEDEDPSGLWNEEPIVAEPSIDSAMKTEALIVTTEDFAEVFEKFAAFHTATGINTKVVTVEEICEHAVCKDNDPMNDTQKAIKNYVMSVEGLRYLVLGGDIEHVPSREVYDKFKIEFIADYEDYFYSDLYYADFSEWDTNGNGKYAEDDGGILSADNDSPVLIANVAVGRISVSTADEGELYFEKIVKHHTAFNTAYTKKSLLLANVATTVTVGNSSVEVNSGYYFESAGKTSSLIPQDYSVKRLYKDSKPSPHSEALPLDNASEKAAIEEGVNIVVHSGHGAPWLLTCEQGKDPDRDFDRNMAYELKNTTLPFFLSCACEAGQFGYNNGDSAGEKLMKAPEGGAIVYLGNTTTGLGIAGGSQFIDEMLKNMFAFPYSVIGESYLYAHATLPQNDTFTAPIALIENIPIPVVTPDSWQWTKKSIVMLGDPMTVFWRDEFMPFEAEIKPEVEENGEIKTVSFHFTPDLEGVALRVLADGKLYEIPYVMNETISINLDKSVEKITVGIRSEKMQYFFKEFDI